MEDAIRIIAIGFAQALIVPIIFAIVLSFAIRTFSNNNF